MAFYEVQVTRVVTHSVVITVEADDEDNADKAAIELAENGVDANEKALDWDFDDEMFDIDSTNEVEKAD